MPFVRNPSMGYYATANDDAHIRPEAHTDAFLGADFVDPYRANTIRDELAKRADWAVPACLALQLSTRSMVWEEIRAVVLNVPTDSKFAREALELLAAWDGSVGAKSPAAAVYELFVAELCVRVAKAKAPKSWEVALGGSATATGFFTHNLFGHRRVAHLANLILAQPAGWFARTWPDEIADVLDGVIRRLRADHGPGPEWWQWGDLRPLRVRHSVLGKHRLFGPIFNAPVLPCGGDSNTISQASVVPLAPLDATDNMANLRIVFDCADFGKSRVALCGGQSGNPLSPHYLDLFRRWQTGDSVPFHWTASEILKGTVATLRLDMG